MDQNAHLRSTPPPGSRKGRRLVLMLGALVVVAFGLPFAISAVFSPWAYFMGGHFHLYPRWAGWGRMHSKVSGDYALYLTIEPWPGRGHAFTDITGTGALCTQRGDTYRLSMAGSFEEGSGADLQGRTATLYPHNYDRRHTGHNDPSLEFRGRWNNPDLVLDDQGSIDRAFAADGGLAQKGRARAESPESVPLTLHEGSRAEFDAACAALKK